jgi:hypothetical protein
MFAMPSGMPMIVMNCATAVMMWPSASHQPAKMNQMTLPMPAPTPADGLGRMVRPNGHSA